jgi:solute:Na+ symporter, SSS family
MGEEGQVAGSTITYVVLVGYFVVVLGFGAVFSKFTKSTKDFFFAGQRFAWWVIAFSLVATTVGSYSFIKYSQVAYEHGVSSSMSYLNDWFWMPLFFFVWLPVIYFSRVSSVPEFFERRFGRGVRNLVTAVMLIYLLGYIGVNLVTMGQALHAMLGWKVTTAAWIVAIVCAVYVTAGGQTSVIMTDLLQGVILLFAGLALLFVGVDALGGFGPFWDAIPVELRAPLRPYNDPPEFNFVGVFWQDGVSQTMFLYFINQGMIMRFLAARSERDGRKAMAVSVLALMFVSMIAVSSGGWIGRALVETGMIPAPDDPKNIFVIVADYLFHPAVFGFLMAAVVAALMSTADTLINATSAVVVNDIWKPYIKPDADDRHYLRVARVVTVGAALVGMALVPLFDSFESIYHAHGAFTASITPPMAVATIFAICWRRFSSRAAFATLGLGIVAMVVSIIWPAVIAPFSFGVEQAGEGFKAWSFQRACYGFVVTFAIGMVAGLVSRKADPKRIEGLVWGTVDEARRRYKGRAPKHDVGPFIKMEIDAVEERLLPPPEAVGAEGFLGGTRQPVRLHPDDLKRMGAEAGDLLLLVHPGLIKGGFLSARGVVAGDASRPGAIQVSRSALKEMGLAGPSHLKVRLLL